MKMGLSLLLPLLLFFSTLGEQKTLVILVNFQDKPDQPFSTAYARDVVFNQTSAYIQEASYNQTWLTGDVYGWFTIPLSYTVCDPRAIESQAKSAAQNAGADLSQYQHFIYWFPANVCAWAGSASTGITPSNMWLKGQRNYITIAHEFGHNLGLWHARSYDCGTETICSNGTVDEYGDRFDAMGPSNVPYAAHYSAYQKEKLGWLQLPIVSGPGDYVIDNYETPGGTKGLKIPKTGGWYYIEKRSAYGFDSFLSDPTYANVRNGLLIHQSSDGDPNPYLLDASPPYDWFDPALTVGKSFIDSAADLSVTLLSVNNSGALVRIACAACAPPPPTPSPTPTPTPSPTATPCVRLPNGKCKK